MQLAQQENAREFLSRALLWPAPGSTPSFVNVHYGVKIPNVDKPVYPGIACRDVSEAQKVIDWAKTKHSNIFVCMSAQSIAEQLVNKAGRIYFKAKRIATNAVGMKSLYLDVDVKPDKPTHGYATRQEAATEFGRIRRALGLPAASMVINSGSGGFHAHWFFDQALSVARWQVLAYALVAGLKAHGFRGDTGCSIDAARLLRPPGTLNHKQTPGMAVTQWGKSGPDYAPEVVETALHQWVGVIPSPNTPTPRASLGPKSAVFGTINNAADELSTGIETNQFTIDEVSLGCPFIAGSLATGGATNTNPLWLQTTNVALFTKDSRTAAHRMASGHPDYQTATTDALFERQEQTKANRDMGWPRCASIAGNGAVECQTCPHLQANKSPLNYAIRTLVAAATVIAGLVATQTPMPAPMSLPNGYGLDQAGFVCRVEQDDAGNQTLARLCSFTIDQPWLQENPAVFNFSTITYQGNPKQIRLPFEAISDKNQFVKYLSRQFVLIHAAEAPGLAAFMVSFIEKLRADRANIVQSAPFGWAVHNGKVTGFVYASHLWSRDIPKPAANPDPVLAAQYTPTGDLKPWIDAARMITDQKRPALDAIIAGSFGAPLVRFTGQTGLLMSTYSTESGIGKSTTLKVGQSVWGNPLTAIQSLNDTQNAVIKKLGDIKNLPLYWDELKGEDDSQKFMHLAFQLAQGKEKSRLQADTSQREPGTWQTLLMSTSNASLLAYILDHTKTTTAGLYRIFEFPVPRGVTGQISASAAQMLTARLNDNYGQAGLAYAQFLGREHERVAREVGEMAQQLEHELSLQADERFWAALIVVILMGAVYANELGLTQIDTLGLRAFLLGVLVTMRGERKTATVDIGNNVNVLSLIARFMNDKRGAYTIVTGTVHQGSGRPPLPQVGSPTTIGPLNGYCDIEHIRNVQIHIGQSDGWCRISKHHLEAWLNDQRIAPTLIIKKFISEFGVKEIRGRMAHSTRFVTNLEPLLEFCYFDPRFQNFIEL